MTDTYYKILSAGHKACHGGEYTYVPGEWTPRIDSPTRCENGWHYTDADHIVSWLYADNDEHLPLELWECETVGGVFDGDKGVAKSIRLTRLVGTLDEYDLRWLGTIFAESVLENTDDPRVGECINIVRAYSLGMADASDLSAAESAAYSAAESAAYSAARSAAWSAARSAARSAAESAAYSAAWSAAWSAARSAAWSAAESAARSAACSANSRAVLGYLAA